MALPKTCIHKSGFTLVEMVIVVGILSILFGISLLFNVSDYQGTAFRAEKSTIVTLLQTARGNAMNNFGEVSHGLALHPVDRPDSYVLFKGTHYDKNAASNVVVTENYPVTFGGGAPLEVVFHQLSGDTDWQGNITLTDPRRNFTSIVSVNGEGRINW